jgi:tetratricopeptide (TPR) repeat protein
METRIIPQEELEKVKEMFANDTPLTDDLQPGTFFQNPAYFDSLPTELKIPICDIQNATAEQLPNRPGMCAILSEAFHTTYKGNKNQKYMDASFTMEAMALHYLPPEHPGRGISNRHMGLLYQRKWEITKNPDDLNRSIHHYRRATQHGIVSDVIKSLWMSDLAAVLEFRKLSDDLEEIEQCIDRSLELSGDHPSKAMCLYNKGYFLVTSAKRDSSEYINQIMQACVYYEQSVSMCKTLITQTPRFGINYRQIFNNSGRGFHLKWELCGDISSINHAIECNKLAAHEYNGNGLWSWGFCRVQSQYLLDRHETTGADEDLAQASEAAENAIKTCGTSELRLGTCKWSLGKTRRRLYRNNVSQQTLQSAIDLFKESAELLPTDPSTQALVLNDLGLAYNMMFDHDTQAKYLEDATEAFHKALSILQSVQDDSASENIRMVNNSLGFAMLQRYLYWKSENDLKASVSCYRRSLEGIDSTFRRYALRAGNLGYALQLLFTLKGDHGILNESQEYLSKALNAPTSPNKVVRNWLETHMGNAFLCGVSISASPLDTMRNALEHYDKALLDKTIPLQDQSVTLVNRAELLHKISELTRSREDWEAAARAFTQLQEVVKPEHPLSAVWTYHRGTFLLESYNRGVGPDVKILGLLALRDFQTSFTDSRVYLEARITSASIAASLTFQIHKDYPTARDFIGVALELLPSAIPFHEDRLAQLNSIRKFHYIPSSLTALSIAADDPPSTIINRLESSRSIIWDRLVDVDSNSAIDVLRDVNEQLAEKFQNLQSKLARLPSTITQPISLSNPNSLFSKDIARLQFQKDEEDYRKLLVQIRSIDGMGDFLKIPENLTGLQNYAKTGPIVFLNASEYRCDALIITKEKLSIVALPQFEMKSITEYSVRFQYCLYNMSLDRTDASNMAYQEYKIITQWLWYSAIKPILDSIDFSTYQGGSSGKPRLFWVSTGWASVLPLHAAGDYDASRKTKECHCVHDMVVSSYITSLKTLTSMRQNALRFSLDDVMHQEQKALIVTMASTPGMDPKYNDLDVESERKAIETRVSQFMPVQILPNPASKAVRFALESCTLAHFACHANANKNDPSKSAIQLMDRLRADGKVKDPPPFCVRTLLKLNLKRCQLVYLSACQTGANTDMMLRDEGIHIASGFHIAGVPHVISTLWKVFDKTSAELSGYFYQSLTENGEKLRFDSSPDALHMAIQKLRDQGEEPLLWGAYVHSGP